MEPSNTSQVCAITATAISDPRAAVMYSLNKLDDINSKDGTAFIDITFDLWWREADHNGAA